MREQQDLKAVKRFGLGAKPGELEAARSDPRGYVLQQLSKPDRILIKEKLSSAPDALRELRGYVQEVRKLQKEEAKTKEAKSTDNRSEAMMELRAERPRRHVDELRARVQHDLRTDCPMLERLVAFWSNHFCVSAKRSQYVRAAAGPYEREAIRPHVLGRFRDMLQASARHPAMLLYLDNARSVGPNSRLGKRQSKGLNENLAREILELHTVGVGGGYTQADVTSFAKALTGWTLWPQKDPQRSWSFRFEERRHEPGAVTIMGRRYAEDGVGQGEAVLDDLAKHPKTAEHVARKLARYFVSESAPQALIDRLAKTFRDSDGDLREVAEALVSSDEAWEAKLVKLIPPYDLMVASFRATEATPKMVFVNETLKTFGQAMWAVDSPAGWPDGDMAWASPDAILERVDWADQAAGEIGDKAPSDVVGLARNVLGDSLADVTHQAISRAESRRQALALLFLSSEFQRR